MMMKNLSSFPLDKKNINELGKTERICIYLHDHKEVLNEKFMIEVVARYLNYAYIRMRIKQLYSKIVQENLLNKNFVIVPSHYAQE